ncbi:MAG: Rieske (2Fe-2S) protein [Actinomycetota bacterium]|nr:Rieske (2Fe-2S) protein [Actinomycetota bacterium]
MSPRALLPVEAYRSRPWFDQEQASLFADRWVLVASAEELTKAADYVTAVAGGAPLVVIRGHDGELRAFHNLCRHRGAMLLQGNGTVNRAVTCAYHQWRYQLDGALAGGTPTRGPVPRPRPG